MMNMASYTPPPPRSLEPLHEAPNEDDADESKVGEESVGKVDFEPGQKLVGQVKWFNFIRGYGFITCDGTNEDVFVHRTGIKAANNSHDIASLADGEKVEFQVSRGGKGLEAKFVTGPNGTPVQGSPFAVGVYDYYSYEDSLYFPGYYGNNYYGNNYGYAGGWHNNRSQQNYRGGSAGRNYGNRSSQMNASRRDSQSDKEPKLDEKQNEADAEKKMPGTEVGAEQQHDETATGETKPTMQSSKGQLHTRNPATNRRMANTNQYQNYHVGQQHRYNNQRDYGYAGNNYYGQYSNFNPRRNNSYYGNQIGGYYGNNNYRNNGYYYYDDGYHGSGYNGNNSYYRNYNNNNKSRGYPNQQHQRGAQREAQGGKKKKPEAEKSEGDAATEEKAVIAAAGKEQKVGDQEEPQKVQAKGKKQHKQHRTKAAKVEESDGSKDHPAGKPEATQQQRGGHRGSVQRSNRRSISEGSAEGEEKVRGCEGGKASHAEGGKKSSAGSRKKEQREQRSNSIGSKPPTALQEYRKSIAQIVSSEANHGGDNGKQKEVVNGSTDAVSGEKKAVQASSTPIKWNEPPQVVVSTSKLAVVTRDDDKAQSAKVAPLSIGESLAGTGSDFGLRAVTPTDAKPPRSPKPSPKSKPAPPVPEKTPKKKVVVEFVPSSGEPKEVKVTGSFNHWQTGVKLEKKEGDGNALFAGELELPLGKHEVKFVVDGDWMLSDKLPKCKVEGHAYENNVLEVV